MMSDGNTPSGPKKRNKEAYRKAMGQHFLKDQSICEKIAERTLDLFVQTDSTVLIEIGPGRGALTLPLLERLKKRSEAPDSKLLKWIIIEKDPTIGAYWKAYFEAKITELTQVKVQVIVEDFLKVPLDAWLHSTTDFDENHGPITLVSNLPYSSGTAIFQVLARHPSRIKAMVLMFQKEVAERLYANPGTKAWGSLSAWTQNNWIAKRLLGVPPRAFTPPPKVESDVVEFLPRVPPVLSFANPKEEQLWETLLKVSFAHRRKMLRSGLPANSPYQNALLSSGVDGTNRAEALEWEDWKKFFEALRTLSTSSN